MTFIGNARSHRVFFRLYHLLSYRRQFVVSLVAFVCGVGVDVVQLGLSWFSCSATGDNVHNLRFQLPYRWRKGVNFNSVLLKASGRPLHLVFCPHFVRCQVKVASVLWVVRCLTTRRILIYATISIQVVHWVFLKTGWSNSICFLSNSLTRHLVLDEWRGFASIPVLILFKHWRLLY